MAKVDGFEMVKTMAANVEVMMQHKIDAIKVNNDFIARPVACIIKLTMS